MISHEKMDAVEDLKEKMFKRKMKSSEKSVAAKLKEAHALIE